MRITSPIFDAFLKCATKCQLRSLGEIGTGNEYAEWVRGQDESYQREAVRKLQETVPETERAAMPPATENLKAAKWRLAVDLVAQTPDRSADSHVREFQPNEEPRELGAPRSEQLLESRLHAVERVPSEGRGKPAQFVPIRFVFRNKLTKDDRLLLAFDAWVLSQVLGREVSLGKIIHGDDHATLKVKTSALTSEVRKRLDKVAGLLSNPAPPDLVLNRHCAECEFQARCRQKALEQDDLSLLAHMSEKERKKFRSKGIFTVTQLSYTFRPRRRPKRMRDKREQYHHSLKALAIREKKIHIVGSPELKIEGTPVYLDVEGLPDRDFYYLIGLRIGNGESAVQHSLWADTVADEGKIWREFLAILETVEKPVLVHYGSYETTFFQRMSERRHNPPQDPAAEKAIGSALNLVAFVFAQIYFPTFSNGLKEIGDWLGFKWAGTTQTGIDSIRLRHEWEQNKQPQVKNSLVHYNTDDCRALEMVVRVAKGACRTSPASDSSSDLLGVVNVDGLEPRQTLWPKFSSPILELEFVNKAAGWDYQRDRIYLRKGRQFKRIAKAETQGSKPAMRVNEEIICQRPRVCPCCEKRFFWNYPGVFHWMV